MNKTQVKEILRLNDDFYKKTFRSFSETRKAPWTGWGRAFDNEILNKVRKPRVLDLACGNGRFYNFLLQKLGHGNFTYIGVDNNRGFIEIASKLYKEARFAIYDIFNLPDSFLQHKFDLVVCFGFTHHIPDNKLRKAFFTQVADFTDKNGTAVITFWSISKNEGMPFSPERSDDYLVGWQNKKGVIRYCHYYTELEKEKIRKLFLTKGLCLAKKYKSDGKDGKSNEYYIFCRADKI